jgi:hypothetical protein
MLTGFNYGMGLATNLDWFAVNRNTIAFSHSPGCALGTGEEDICNTTASSARSIGKFNSLDGSYHLDKVLLFNPRFG